MPGAEHVGVVVFLVDALRQSLAADVAGEVPPAQKVAGMSREHYRFGTDALPLFQFFYGQEVLQVRHGVEIAPVEQVAGEVGAVYHGVPFCGIILHMVPAEAQFPRHAPGGFHLGAAFYAVGEALGAVQPGRFAQAGHEARVVAPAERDERRAAVQEALHPFSRAQQALAGALHGFAGRCSAFG